MTTGFCWPKR